MSCAFRRSLTAAASIALLTGCNSSSALKTACKPEMARISASAAPQAQAKQTASLASAYAGAPECSDEVIEQILTPASVNPAPVKLTCSATLPAEAAVVTRQILFEGQAASGGGIDCNGARLEGTAPRGDREALVIRSRKSGDTWSRPTRIIVRGCRIANGLRIYGLGRNSEAEEVKRSSMNRDHTSFAQGAAPNGILLDNLRFTATGGIPLYVGPGVTNVTLTNSRFTGTSSSVAIYLDAESGGANISGNVFDLRTSGRELIAVDGSAHNAITGNRFNSISNGGIFVYRNCGEGGTIRHQAPRFNRIENNTFALDKGGQPAVWLNSRGGNRSYCFTDPDHPYGSSLTSQDMAQDNIVANNLAIGGTRDAFRNDDPSNRLSGNGECE